jgi:soluble lytic murein transglycosylase-like protein
VVSYSEVVKARLLTCGLVIVAGLISGPARADIYAYTSPDGTIHFSNVPDDPHYKLVVRTPVEPTASPGSANAAARWLAHSADYDAAIQRAAFASEVHPALLRAVIVVESGFNPRAISRRGAIGLMQLLPGTARRYGAFNAFDPEQNIHAGARYLAALITRFGGDNLELVLAAYNAGEAAVEKYGRQIPPYRETQLYVPNVLKMYRALLDQAPEPAAGSES